MIIYAHRNSLKKFYATDKYACTITEKTSTLKGKLTERIIQREDSKKGEGEVQIEQEVMEFKRNERKAANLYRMSKDDVLVELDRAISYIRDGKDPDCHNENFALNLPSNNGEEADKPKVK